MRGALEKVPGVESVAIDFEAGTATVKARGVEADALVKAVGAARDGMYTATVQ